MNSETQNIELNHFIDGFMFFKSYGNNLQAMPTLGMTEDHQEWIKGYCCALSDYDLDREYRSIEQALINQGIDNDLLLSELLESAEYVLKNSTEFLRWPNIPIRQFPTPKGILDDPSMSNWLKEAIQTSLYRDPVDAARDAELLYRILNERCRKTLNIQL